ncbi:MAG TPA: aspartyl-tRNA amidotransferase [Bdellovibrionales bacterium]|nr:MAG: aspartyl-tRNA amidotransferase [Bdellovibrionales bacterium GWB1_52_6]OFZ02661.1 MAG: aspartyl-tRNA amidotransferase [Bdellovibrionales bacterium GWA1_52_35]OFZ35671.1 MAG: aspartyl-tRNA amidotransferase [Bdellovibrionales bacterium GWC1_52_8]HAR44408.1 aspartyl-tRNA amidotransferase [Bdellovibrionales bacterium]HCM41334.1 aspartyl-tRNA amidotransferase [Bdellovibrionales bacterium]
MATIKERLSEMMKASMKAGAKETLSFVRNLHAAIRKKEIDDRKDLDDAAVLKIIASSIKQRQDSIDQFRAGNREDLVAKETAELQFLQSFLPKQMEESEVRSLVDWAVTESKAAGPKDIGNVMKLLMPKVQGLADGKLVNQLVRERLGQG